MRSVVETDALVVRTVAYGEADVIATFVTETHGKLSAIVRGARKSKRRAQGALEPFHTVRVSFEDRGGDLVTIRDARVVRVRAGILASLPALEAGGLALRWLRHLVPARHPGRRRGRLRRRSSTLSTRAPSSRACRWRQPRCASSPTWATR